MSGVFASTYVPRFLACLAAQSDSNRLYAELADRADVLLPQIGKAAYTTPIRSHVDERIVPFLARYVSSGTDAFFEALCILALRVNAPTIDPVLSGLFYRWTQKFDIGSPISQQDQNHELWRGFNRLAEHPRFSMIEGWQSRLANVMRARLSWFRSETITRVLERDPRSYIQIESLLFKAANWEHYNQDEIDRLDAAAEKLFPQMLEE